MNGDHDDTVWLMEQLRRFRFEVAFLGGVWAAVAAGVVAWAQTGL